jgi:hypothetical protein
MKMEVIASKGVLVSDPAFKKMNRVRWMFEYLGMVDQRKRLIRDLALLLVGETIQDLDLEKTLRIIPLAYVLNPDVVNEYMREVQKESQIQKDYMSDEEYEEMLRKVEESGHALDDIELLDGEE